MRIACVFVPQLALQAALRRLPELRGAPVALVEAPPTIQRGPRARGALGRDRTPSAASAPAAPAASIKRGTKPAKIVMISAEARRAGVRVGSTAAQAAATCPNVTVLPVVDADLEAAAAALADLGFAFAPRIEQETARVFFEIGDLGQLYSSEVAITQAIQARGLRVGLGVRVAIAARKGVARIATRAGERIVIPAGEEKTFLAPLPLRVLGEPLPDATVETFGQWGIETIGALARLPAAGIGLRLGAEGARLHRLARGDDDEPFLPALPADAIEEGLQLDDAIAELEPLSFVLRGLFDRVLARLACRSLACAAMTLRFQLESRAFDVREVNLAAPTRETAPLLQLARLDLTRRPPDAPIVAVLVLARPARVRAAQMDFLRPAGPAPDRLAATIARLGALCGPDNVGAPQTVDTWREEAVAVTPFTPGAPTDAVVAPLSAATTDARAATRAVSAQGGGDGDGDGGARTLTIRRYRPPEQIEVMWGPDGPAALRGKETTARILIAAGPYRMSGEWWRREDTTSPSAPLGFSRDYWDVHASDGALYRLHHDRNGDRWYLDGYYD